MSFAVTFARKAALAMMFSSPARRSSPTPNMPTTTTRNFTPASRSYEPNVIRGMPVMMSTPMVVRMSPNNTDTLLLMRLPPPNPASAAYATIITEKYSGGPQVSAYSATGRADNVKRMMQTVPAMKADNEDPARARAPSPFIAIGYPSNAL